MGKALRDLRKSGHQLARTGDEPDVGESLRVLEGCKNRLHSVIAENPTSGRQVARHELDRALRTLESYTRNFTSNIGEELADLLDWRSAAHEVAQLLENLGEDLTESRVRLDRIDAELRKNERWFAKEGIARDPRYLDAEPPEYWWYGLGRESQKRVG